jgi:hypothetical protein
VAVSLAAYFLDKQDEYAEEDENKNGGMPDSEIVADWILQFRDACNGVGLFCGPVSANFAAFVTVRQPGFLLTDPFFRATLNKKSWRALSGVPDPSKALRLLESGLWFSPRVLSASFLNSDGEYRGFRALPTHHLHTLIVIVFSIVVFLIRTALSRIRAKYTELLASHVCDVITNRTELSKFLPQLVAVVSSDRLGGILLSPESLQGVAQRALQSMI